MRSAYNLGLERHMQEQNVGASSNHPDGSRPEWNIQWRCQVPPKVCIFAWKACRDALATQVNMQRRKMVIHGTCTICGKEEEDTFHALVTCPHAQGLWQAMRSCWDLPGDAQVQRTGPDWLLLLLPQLNEIQRTMLLMLLWRVWRIHNELTHDKPAQPVEASRRFLCSYVESLLFIQQFPQADVHKGKEVVDFSGRISRYNMKLDGRQKVQLNWCPPSPGRLKLNVDGGFILETGEAGAGMVLRDHDREVLLAACRSLSACSSSLEAELAACHEGLKLALSWSPLPIDLETDCSELRDMISSKEPDRSAFVHLVHEIRDCLGERDIRIRKIDRSQNAVAHSLASLGRSSGQTACWLKNYPEEVALAVQADCISPTS